MAVRIFSQRIPNQQIAQAWLWPFWQWDA
jgi:hypothetical protein